jgi:hypothetical protein
MRPVSANIAVGAFAPTVWMTSSGFSMLLTGRKLVSGSTYQTKIILATSSSDGISWSGPSPAVNPSVTNSNFDYSNLNSPDLLHRSGLVVAVQALYSGNTLDANGNFPHAHRTCHFERRDTAFGKVTVRAWRFCPRRRRKLETAFDARRLPACRL